MDEVVPVELEDFGEDTLDMLRERVYPIYHKASMEIEEDFLDDESAEVPQEKIDAAFKRLNDAITTERNRQWGAKEPVLSKDEAAADLQRSSLRVPKAVAERIVKEHRRRQMV